MDTPDRPYLDIQIRPNATSGPRKPSRRSPAGSAPRKPPATGTPSAATPPPRKSTGTRSSPSSTTHSPATPGYRQFRPTPELRPKPVTHRYPYVARAPECLPQLVGNMLVQPGFSSIHNRSAMLPLLRMVCAITIRSLTAISAPRSCQFLYILTRTSFACGERIRMSYMNTFLL